MPVAGILPITALTYGELSGVKILLAGRGCALEVYSTDARLIYGKSVLERQTIHGIVVINACQIGNKLVWTLLGYGGRYIVCAELDVTLECEKVASASIRIIGSAELPEWVLCCKAQVSTRSALIVTSYNTVVEVSIAQNEPGIECVLLCNSLCTFLYSADIGPINDKNYLIASGTAFGEVLTWVCHFDGRQKCWQAIPWRKYHGHTGSVFNLSISSPFIRDGEQQRVLATCSDDRTIRVWDLSTIEDDTIPSPQQSSNTEHPTRDSFVLSSDCLSSTWAHTSRVWSADFSHNLLSSNNNCSLILSAGEDGQVQAWELDIADMFQLNTNTYSSLKLSRTDRHHSGKNVWARWISQDEQHATLYTGAADGQIISRSYLLAPLSSATDAVPTHFVQPFKSIRPKVDDSILEFNGEKKSLTLKSYLLVDVTRLLVTTEAGALLRGTIERDAIRWELIAQDDRHKPLIMVSSTASHDTLFVSSSTATLCAIDLETFSICRLCETRHLAVSFAATAWHSHNGVSELCVAIAYHAVEEIDFIWLSSTKTSGHVSKTSLLLPTTFEVTSVCYDQNSQVLLCGSRSGAIAVYSGLHQGVIYSHPKACRRHVHASDTITSMTILDHDPNYNTSQDRYYVTTGRDGTYSVLKLCILTLPDEEIEVKLDIVHQISTPFGPNVEGATIIAQPNDRPKLLLYGFRAKDFVVWDETEQTQVMAVDCGGAHRSWNLKVDEANASGCTFVWTQAKSFMMHRQMRSDHKVIQRGGHGREIKALAVHRTAPTRWLIATGSEDTDIRLFTYDEHEAGKAEIRNTTVLQRHTTGLQHLQLTTDGQRLISAAGMEEMYAWRLSTIPILRQGAVFAASLPKIDTQSDARIMSFDIQSQTQQHDNTALLIVAAFSNGRFKTISYIDTSYEASFTVLRQLDLGTICLTQAQFLPSAQPLGASQALIAGTDGIVRKCDVLPPLTEREFKNLASKDISCPQHKVHQNNITALSTIHLTSHYNLLVTGGDDNALAFTLLQYSPPTDVNSRFRTILVPKAHAAALTALVTIDLDGRGPIPHERKNLAVVTAGTDQRVQVWSVTVDLRYLRSEYQGHGDKAVEGKNRSKRMMDEIQIDLVKEIYTDVADISDMEVMFADLETQRARVLVVGVGMEMIDISLP